MIFWGWFSPFICDMREPWAPNIVEALGNWMIWHENLPKFWFLNEPASYYNGLSGWCAIMIVHYKFSAQTVIKYRCLGDVRTIWCHLSCLSRVIILPIQSANILPSNTASVSRQWWAVPIDLNAIVISRQDYPIKLKPEKSCPLVHLRTRISRRALFKCR